MRCRPRDDVEERTVEWVPITIVVISAVVGLVTIAAIVALAKSNNYS